MPVITRTAWTDDDGSGTTGTVINNAVKTELYNQIDAVVAAVAPATGQLVFPASQNASANANTLDDYEEGMFTPTIVSSGGGTPTYAQQSGGYTKIGQLVQFQIGVILATLGTLAAGNIMVGGLPFASHGNLTAPVSVPMWVLTTAAVAVPAEIAAGTSVVTLYLVTVATANAFNPLTQANLAATTRLWIHGCYRAAA